MLHDPVTDEIAARYLKDLQDENIDSLILGCTHYPLLRGTVAKIMGSGVHLVNPAYETALELGRLLQQKQICAEDGGKVEHAFYVSDAEEKFKDFANSIMPFQIELIEQIQIESY